jgi:ATP-dependent Lon protease
MNEKSKLSTRASAKSKNVSKEKEVKQPKKKVVSESDSDSDSDYISFDEDEDEEESELSDDDEYETLSESDSTYVPPKKTKNLKNKIKKTKREETEEEEEGDEEEEEEEEEEVDPKKFRKLLSDIFPSNYIKKKVRKDEDESEEEEPKKRRTSKPKNNKKKPVESDEEEEEEEPKKRRTRKPKNNKKKQEDEASDEEEEASEEEQASDDDEQKFNIVFTIGGAGGGLGLDEPPIDDENEECDSEDEKMFMKEKYEQVDLPTNKKVEAEKKRNKEKKHKKKSKEEKAKKAREITDAEGEYVELHELRKHLAEKLHKKPDSKMLHRAMKDVRDQINKLVKKSRTKNAKTYYELINFDPEETNEIDFFKKNLSNKEQIRVMKELQEINSHLHVEKPYRVRLLESSIPPKYKATVMQKLNTLHQMDPSDSEYYKIKNWVDTFMRVPFSMYKSLSVSMTDGIEKCSDFMENAKTILDDCVYGLDDAKMQILQMVGQWVANPSAMGTAIAIKGPMGTGKTTLVKEGISKILGREFAFMALGGAGDASFLEGHSYTYEGSSWGKIVQILIDSKCMNPVIYFDELDKISDTPRGEEIIGILTHLTDTTQNSQFHDKFFSEIDFDLSKCLFIFSYNDESKVNSILKDRMYRIQTKGYDAKEKMTIARKYLLPKIREQVNFTEEDIILPDETLNYIITHPSYTMGEDGVRNLKRCLEIIHTKLNLFRLVKPGNTMFSKNMELEVTFPYTVSKKAVDVLIKTDETQNQSLLAMYV